MPSPIPIYNLELAKLVCRKIATHDIGTAALCEMYEDMPSKTTIYEWCYDYPEFEVMYLEAKEKQANRLAESIEDIANEKLFYYDAEGNKRVDSGFTQDKRLRIDTRKWIAMKLQPKRYADVKSGDTTVVIKHEDALKELG
jgi:hypothetical protein